MKHPDAILWDERYTNESTRYSQKLPRPLVTTNLNLFPQNGLVLDAACGTTPTGMFLASRGWQVVALDVSIAALRLVQPQVQKEALPVSSAVMDLKNPWLPQEYFDVVLNFYYLSRPLLQTYRKSIKPGGLLFLETFLREETSSSNMHGIADHYLDSLELMNTFKDWSVIHYMETHRTDRPGWERKIAQFVARKPL